MMSQQANMEPQRIGKYELAKFLGGGMSHVYKAVDTLIGRTVAVKILTPQGAANEDTKSRFIREAQLAGNVIHENIIRVYDFGDEAGQLFMVMEFLEGEDLSDAIRQGHTGSVAERLSTGVQITRAMEHIHGLGIVHRDLKPQNVYITRAGVAKLMDFGIAKTDQTSMTKTGFSVGTPSYMAPEQVLGKQVNHLSDIYAFGILLFELITGSKPLSGDSVERVFWQILNEPIDLAPLREAGAPERVIDLIRRCTEKDPAARPQNFSEVRREMEPAVQVAGTPIPRPPEPAPSTTAAAKPKKWLLPAVIGAVALCVAAAWLLTRPKAVPPHASAPTVTDSPKAPEPNVALPSGDMVLVPAGSFLFGEHNEKRDAAAFYIDKTEVTNEAYKLFMKATNYAAPPGFSAAASTLPVVNVKVEDARQFARWAGKRLPTSLEWEKAARGVDGRQYPWGNEADPKLAVVKQIGLVAAAYPLGASPYGAVQMAGNAWEFVDEPLTPSPGALAHFAGLSPKATVSEPWVSIRGGSYLESLQKMWDWSALPERFWNKDVGFRCVRDVK